jgi:hypothetical protein
VILGPQPGFLKNSVVACAFLAVVVPLEKALRITEDFLRCAAEKDDDDF